MGMERVHGRLNLMEKHIQVFLLCLLLINNIGAFPSPDYSSHFYFGYSMFPKSPSVLYIYFRIYPDNLLFEVNKGGLTFDEVNIYGGKYDGFMSTMYFHNLGGLYAFFDRNYWIYCQTPQNVTRSICLQCGPGQFLYVYGLCHGNI